MTTHLISTTGIEARIHSLPGREPFMLGVDLAEAYETRTDRLTEAVRRNPARFPEDFAFRLTEAETEQLKTQNALSSMVNKALPLAFTHAGALALSGVLKTSRAAEVSVIVHRGFAVMEKQALREVQTALIKHGETWISRSPRLVRMREWARHGWAVDQIWKAVSVSRRQVEEDLLTLRRMNLIDALPAGMQPGLFMDASDAEA